MSVFVKVCMSKIMCVPIKVGFVCMHCMPFVEPGHKFFSLQYLFSISITTSH